ncbi:hypothetical protein [Endozoicomonas sp. 8E]|uniref:hypothetical protein n=1 Tax=Endozoicomonas sp. 8E TaxID=3035692 RepID=UPI002938F414|nr:hypothetical protein [Endozoicomonas sp. 8E]WOG29776.1 hypothetical protein P6910_09000 [Endozoicomonas sp. 8E]
MIKKYFYVFLLVVLTGCLYASQDDTRKYVYRGSISGYAYDEYKLYLHKNDNLLSNLKAKNLEVIIYSPVSLTLENDKPIEILKDGMYVIRVLMKRAFSRRDATYNYELSIWVCGH